MAPHNFVICAVTPTEGPPVGVRPQETTLIVESPGMIPEELNQLSCQDQRLFIASGAVVLGESLRQPARHLDRIQPKRNLSARPVRGIRLKGTIREIAVILSTPGQFGEPQHHSPGSI